MKDWVEIYRSLLNQKIAGLVWLPITSDTPQLAMELSAASFSFSGGVYVRFEAHAALNLSWGQVGERCVLATRGDANWAPHVLDRLHASGWPPWGNLIGSTLISAEMFGELDDAYKDVVGIRHRTTGGSFWVGTGGPDGIREGDDLWVGVECDPPNRPNLVSLSFVC